MTTQFTTQITTSDDNPVTTPDENLETYLNDNPDVTLVITLTDNNPS
jgi:hypothetical protein